MSADRDTWVPLRAIAAHVARSRVSVYADARLGLLRLAKRPGIRGSWATVAEVNRYVKRKFWGVALMVAPCGDGGGAKDSQN